MKFKSKLLISLMAVISIIALVIPGCDIGTGAAGDNVYQGSNWTDGYVPIIDADGNLSGDADLTFSGSTLTATDLDAPTGRTATYVIASPDSIQKDQADVVLSGTDDQIILNQYLLLVSAVKGTLKTFGTINATGSILIPSNVFWDARDTKVISSTDKAITNSDISGGNSNIVIDGLELDGNSQLYGILFYKCADSVVKNCSVYSLSSLGIRFWDCTDSDIENNLVFDINGTGIGISSLLYSAGATNTSLRNNVTKNTVRECDEECIEVEFGAYDTTVEGNRCINETAPGDCINIDDWTVESKVLNNTCKNAVANGIDINRTRNSVCTGNSCEMSTTTYSASGIKVAYSSGVHISDNKIIWYSSRVNTRGIYILDSFAVTASFNILNGWYNRLGEGISIKTDMLGDYPSPCSVIGNTVTGFSYGINFDVAASTYSRGYICSNNNCYYQNWSGIEVGLCQESLFSENMIIGYLQYGIDIYRSKNCTYSENTCSADIRALSYSLLTSNASSGAMSIRVADRGLFQSGQFVFLS
ncbi:MAG: right-handed parallel beta-helix repeat-containing protein, partial [Dehalococcoidales bacterium]|nr:right-handed parallel beta-helix repeat-containing protein [Dehalococcoidales bacterium]